MSDEKVWNSCGCCQKKIAMKRGKIFCDECQGKDSILDANEALLNATVALSKMPEMQAKLVSFVNYWGIDGYEPDDDLRKMVCNIVHGMIASANAVNNTLL